MPAHRQDDHEPAAQLIGARAGGTGGTSRLDHKRTPADELAACRGCQQDRRTMSFEPPLPHLFPLEPSGETACTSEHAAKRAKMIEIAEGLERASRLAWRWLREDDSSSERAITLRVLERLSRAVRQVRDELDRDCKADAAKETKAKPSAGELLNSSSSAAH